MKVKSYEPLDSNWCLAETDEGTVHMPIEQAEKLLVKEKKPTPKKPAKKAETKKKPAKKK